MCSFLMLVSHRKRFIYTKTNKTAGTSVEAYFEKHCVPEGTWSFSHSRDELVSPAGIVGFRGKNRDPDTRWWNHMPAALIKQQVGDEVWKRYFKFCVIRDPFDQAISRFHFQRSRSEAAAVIPRDLSDGAAKSPIDPELKAQFKAWLLRQRFRDRDRYTIESEICVDYFIRYESLEEGIKQVCATIGVPFEAEKIPRLKAGLRPEYPVAEYYDRETIAFVANACRFELKHFGYRPPMPA